MQVYTGLYLGRAPRTKETLPDFLKWRRVTRPPLVFRGLTGSQRTPGFWGVTIADQALSGAATTAASVASAPARSQDPAWAHGQVIIGNRNSALCLHCKKRINGGGITRFKYHLAGV